MANQYDTNLKLQAIADAIGDSQSSGLISALEDIADAVAGGGGGGSSAAGLVSDNFSDTDTYDMGDYCIHNNTLYVCINAINTPGPWDLSDWQATNAGIQLSSLNSALTWKTFVTDGQPTNGEFDLSSISFRELVVYVSETTGATASPHTPFYLVNHDNMRLRNGWYGTSTNYQFGDITLNSNTLTVAFYKNGSAITAYYTIYYR